MTKRRSNPGGTPAPESAESKPMPNQAPQSVSSPEPQLPKDQPAVDASEPIEVEGLPVEDDPALTKLHVADAKSSSADSAMTRLESTIAELNTQLATVQQTATQRETELSTQIAWLQAELQTKQRQIDKLQAELGQTGQLKTELEDAKKMILQLSQINAQPAPSAPAPRVQAAEPKLAASSSVQAAPPPAATKATRPAYPLAARRTERADIVPRGLPAMSSEQPAEAAATPQNSKLSDNDLGWVD
jgi:prefoldin subunit 5